MAPTLSDRGLRRLAWALAAFAVVAEAATPAVGSGLDALPGVHGPVYEPLQLVQVAVWCPAALLVISARPRNPIGWLLLGVPLLGSVQNFAGAYGTHAFARPQDGLPLGALAVLVGSSLWPGRRNSQIATALGAADKTVRNHVSAILLKLQVPDRTAAAVKARDAGLGQG